MITDISKVKYVDILPHQTTILHIFKYTYYNKIITKGTITKKNNYKKE